MTLTPARTEGTSSRADPHDRFEVEQPRTGLLRGGAQRGHHLPIRDIGLTEGVNDRDRGQTVVYASRLLLSPPDHSQVDRR